MPEALVNVSDNYNRSKVMLLLIYQGRHEDWNDYNNEKTLPILMKIRMSKNFRLYAGKSVDKILKYPKLLWYNASI